MRYFYQSIAAMMIAYLMISVLFITSIFVKEYNWWLASGAMVLWILSLVPSAIIIKNLFGGRDVWK